MLKLIPPKLNTIIDYYWIMYVCVYMWERKTDLNSSTPFNNIYTHTHTTVVIAYDHIFSFLFVLGYNKGMFKFCNFQL